MIHSCELCGNDFLTEADPYVVRPTPKGVKLYCYCMIKGDEMKAAEKLKEENKKLVEALKFYANERYWEGREIDGDDWHDFYEDGNGIGGKLARQVLKEIGEE
jgi:hypothetical protein